MPKCGAKTRSGTPCKRSGMKNGRCRMHGGTQVRGPEHHSYTHGRYSKALPSNLAESFQTFMADENRTEAAAEIAIVSTRVNTLLGTLQEGGTGTSREFSTMLDKFEAAMKAGDAAEFRLAMTSGRELVETGLATERTWEAVLRAVEQRRKLVDTELRREQRAYETVTAAELAAFVAQVVDIVTRHVDDPKALNAITMEFDERLLH